MLFFFNIGWVVLLEYKFLFISISFLNHNLAKQKLNITRTVVKCNVHDSQSGLHRTELILKGTINFFFLKYLIQPSNFKEFWYLFLCQVWTESIIGQDWVHYRQKFLFISTRDLRLMAPPSTSQHTQTVANIILGKSW